MELVQAKDLYEAAEKAKEEECKKHKENIIKYMIKASKDGAKECLVENSVISSSFEKELRDKGYLVIKGLISTRISWDCKAEGK